MALGAGRRVGEFTLRLDNLLALKDKTKKRVGRGDASGKGGSAGRGMKGQKARAGASRRIGGPHRQRARGPLKCAVSVCLRDACSNSGRRQLEGVGAVCWGVRTPQDLKAGKCLSIADCPNLWGGP